MLPDEQYDLLVASAEWSAYSGMPTPTTLRALLGAADAAGLRGSIPRALANLFSSSSSWRVAQHLANEFIDPHRDTTLAEYYAAKAVELSGGRELAPRLSLARCFWLQRFPEAVLSELQHAESLLATYEPVDRRPAFLREIIDLYVNAYCYSNRIDLARPWIDRLLQRGQPVRGDTLVQTFTSAFHHGERDLAVRLAKLLALHFSDFNTRVQQQVFAVLRADFLRTLRARR